MLKDFVLATEDAISEAVGLRLIAEMAPQFTVGNSVAEAWFRLFAFERLKACV